MKEKIVCFAGHRYDFQNIGIKDKLKEEIVKLINKGYTTFFDGGKGFFDKLSASIVIELKKQYSQIKIYRILTYYHHNKDKWELWKNKKKDGRKKWKERRSIKSYY